MADGTSRQLDFGQELVVDLFAGGGGASLGIARAYRDPDVAVNHNPVAIAVHTVNHPNTVHHTCDVFEIDPVLATGGRPVGVLWASPDCRHHSKAKGGKPRSKKIRGLAWVAVKWAAACLPRLIHLENVEEFADWGPLLADGSPCKVRKGMTFRRWVRQLERLGYRIEHRELVAADYGAPTIRKRLYVIARRDGRPIVWPKPSHSKTGAGGLPKWRTAAECIDFSLPANSIFGRKKPLADNTQRRVAKGLWRYVLNCPEPFIVPMRGTSAGHTSAHSIRDPLSTVTGQGTHHALVTPFLTEHANASTQRVFSADEPLRTQVAQIKGGHFALVAPHITKFRANSIGSGMDEPVHTVTAGGDMTRPAGAAHAMGVVAAHLTHLTHQGERSGNSCSEPLRTVTGAHRGEQAVVSAFMSQASGGPNGHIAIGHDVRSPVSTITGTGSHQQLVAAYLVKFYSCGGQWQGATEPMHTVPTKDRMGLVQSVHVPANTLAPDLRDRAKACADFLHRWLPEHFPEHADLVLLGDYALVDITLRMLVPRELARAQGFPDSYVLERGPDGQAITKTDQVRLIGNSVCPDVAEALIRANAADLINLYRRAAA